MGRPKLWIINTIFINGNFNAQRYHDEILRPLVVPFIYRHHLMFQPDNTWPHVAKICTQYLEAENIAVLPWPAYSADMSPVEHVWDALDWRVWQRVPVPVNIKQFRKAIEEEWDNIPQATINSLLNSVKMACCIGQMVVTPDTHWFSDPRPNFIFFILKVSVTNRCMSVFPVM